MSSAAFVSPSFALLGNSLLNIQLTSLQKAKFGRRFECEDNNFVYKIGKSKYGVWLSRSKKDIMVMTIENNNNGPNNEDNNNHDIPTPSRPAAFLNDDDNNNSESVTSAASAITQQPNQQSLEQQNHQQTTFEYSIKLEETQKNVRVSVHVYSHSKESASKEAIDLLLSTKDELRKKGLRVIENEGVGVGEIE